MAMTLELSHQPMHPIFTLVCRRQPAGHVTPIRDVPFNQPRFHRRNCRSKRGGLSPAGVGVGRGNPPRHSLYQTTTAITWCAGASRHERLL